MERIMPVSEVVAFTLSLLIPTRFQATFLDTPLQLKTRSGMAEFGLF